MALNNQMLNHFKEKFGIVTVVNATFYAVDDAEPLISFDTLKMSNITSEGQQKEIRGGQGAELLLQYDFGRTANVEITDALVSMGSLEYLFGGKNTADGITKDILRHAKVITTTGVAQGGSISAFIPGDVKAGTRTDVLYVTPAGVKGKIQSTNGVPTADIAYPVGTQLDIFYTAVLGIGAGTVNVVKVLTGTFGSSPALPGAVGASPVAANEYLADTDVTVVWTNVDTGDVHTFVSNESWPVVGDLDEAVAQGDTYTIYYQSVETTGFQGSEMILRASDFPPTVRMIGETVVLDADTGRKIAMQIEIPKLKLNANFTFSFDAEGDPSVFDFSGVALSHKGELLIVRTLGEI
jgi:hypothetical protein